MKPSILVLCALSLTIMACGGGGSSNTSNSGQNVQTPPEKQTLIINGIATDAPLAGATVTLMMDGEEIAFSTTTDNDGQYSLELEYDDADLDDFISLKAMGTGSQANAGLISLVGELSSLVNDAGSDNVLDASENFAVTVSHITTATYGLMVKAAGSELVHSEVMVEQLAEKISQQDVLTVATAIKVAIDKSEANADLALPPGFDDTLELMRYSGSMDEYVASVVLTKEFDDAQKETLEDPTIYDASLTFPTSFELFFTDAINYIDNNPAFKFSADGTGQYQEHAFTWEHHGNSIDIAFADSTYFESYSFHTDLQTHHRVREGWKNITFTIISQQENTLSLAATFTTETYYPDNPEIDTKIIQTSEFKSATMKTYLISFATPITLHLPLANFGHSDGLSLQGEATKLRMEADKFTFKSDGTAIGEITGISVNWKFENDELVLDYLGSSLSWDSDYAFPFTSMKLRKVSDDNFLDLVQVKLEDGNGIHAFSSVYNANLTGRVGSWQEDSVSGIYTYGVDVEGGGLDHFYFILHENGDADTISTYDDDNNGSLSEDEVIRFYGKWKVEGGNIIISRTKLRSGSFSPQCREPGYINGQEECVLYHERTWDLLSAKENEYFIFHKHHYYYSKFYSEDDFISPDSIQWDLRRLYKIGKEPVDLSHLDVE
ncbi:carboxypeptidase-like regulatory domain-containing protein [Alteromonas sp. ASW11-130]|uniref:carboxypeptidase-like regulatory domain-containing protein n=1 Tax=Alteromonas sp. ASW11-130 TaxID=3015775 RepID=UPI002241F4FE|nr:carboxypeptidase-like regulatory domain-containing protein [Alteromonas sp. ASW11-130]MCW8090654.1 carboxypeptidase-like regulatory domain-containing protein [Alteromonas sp. ASW11-130]